MILTVEEVRREISTEKNDQALEARLQALESSIKRYTNNTFKRVKDENNGEYPSDVKHGVLELLRYDLRDSNEIGVHSRSKMGVSSESISRHSVTYQSTNDDNFAMGYPKKMLGFLKPYMCARFGQGLSV